MAIVQTKGPLVDINKKIHQAHRDDAQELLEELYAERKRIMEPIWEAEDNVEKAQDIVEEEPEDPKKALSEAYKLYDALIKDNQRIRKELLPATAKAKKDVRALIEKLKEMKKNG